MALTLTMNLHDKVYVQDYELELIAAGQGYATLRGADGREWDLHEDRTTEVVPQVMVHIGFDNDFPETLGFKAGVPSARVVFRAHRSIAILREGVYLKGRDNAGHYPDSKP